MASDPSPPTTRLINIMAAQLSLYMKRPNPNLLLVIDPRDVRVWYGLIFGLDEPYKGGEYLFKLQAPNEFPEKPPRFEFLTQNGVFQPGGPICISIGEYHANNAPGKDGSHGWRAALGMKGFAEQVVNGLIVPEYLQGGIRIELLPAALRKKYAVGSRARNADSFPEIVTLFEDLIAACPESEPVRTLQASRGVATPAALPPALAASVGPSPKGRAAPHPIAGRGSRPITQPRAGPSQSNPARNADRGTPSSRQNGAEGPVAFAVFAPSAYVARPARPGLYTIEAAKKQAILAREMNEAARIAAAKTPTAPPPHESREDRSTRLLHRTLYAADGADSDDSVSIADAPASIEPSVRLGQDRAEDAALLDSLMDDEFLAAGIALSLTTPTTAVPAPVPVPAPAPALTPALTPSFPAVGPPVVPAVGPPVVLPAVGPPVVLPAELTDQWIDSLAAESQKSALADSDIDDLLGDLLY